MDFWISEWISGFRIRFLDFRLDFWISEWISRFLDFRLDFCQQCMRFLTWRTPRKSVRRRAKRTYYFERVRECERVFEPHRTRGYGRFSRRPHALFASLGAAALSRTHCSQLHSVMAAFTLCLLSFARQAPSSFLLAPITIFAILTS